MEYPDLKTYVWTARELSHTYPVAEILNRPGSTERLRKWTITVHTKQCRHAPKESRNQHPYVGQNGYTDLAQNGLSLGTRYTHTVWRGCRNCGTSEMSDNVWREIGQRYVDKKRAAEQADRNRRDEEWRLEQIREAAQKAQNAAEYEWLEQHKAEREAVRRAALLRWSVENPEDAAAIGVNHSSGDAESPLALVYDK